MHVCSASVALTGAAIRKYNEATGTDRFDKKNLPKVLQGEKLWAAEPLQVDSFVSGRHHEV